MATRTPPVLSKSRLQSGRQCVKRLWLELHQPDALEWGEGAQARLDEGTRFGELARELLGGGHLIDADHRQFDQALMQTQALLSQARKRVPRLFEAAFQFRQVRVRVDALERGARGDTLIEVKSTTSVKDEHLWDCAIQAWVLRGAGRPLRRVELAHVNRDFVYTAPGDYAGLLVREDITAEVDALMPQVPGLVERLQRVARGSCPSVTTGPHCHTPYECPLLTYCRTHEPAPPPYPIDLLPRGGAVVERLRREGYVDLRKVPLRLLEREQHQRIARATRSAQPHISDRLAPTLAAIPFPRHYLDFETISFVVPRWLRTRPFEPVPFQFSCHHESAPGNLRHTAFLDLSGESPLVAFAERLLDAAGEGGPIIVWNQAFEASRVRALAGHLPKRRKALLALVDRMVDLLPIYREHYYHRDMRGSWSIKAVLPTIAPDLDYADLAVGDGQAAQLAYLEAIHPATETRRRDELQQQLLAYCERDTRAMVRLAHWRGDEG